MVAPTHVVCLIVVLATFISEVRAVNCKPNDERDNFGNCSGCMQEAGEGCGWCLDKDLDGLAKGCVTKKECISTFVEKKTTQTGGGGSNTGYIQPSNVQLKMRPNINYKLNFKGKKAQNAVDIYFLLDLSGSMEPLKKALAKIPQDLVEAIEMKTNDYNFGYGAFREKPMPPFGPLADEPDDYEHLLSMTKDTNQLIQAIKKSKVEGNYDTPEAGLDGLMQVLLCDEKIGWRVGATGIIVLITDAPSHIAGDGILGGLWKPYEHNCTLKKNRKGVEVYDSLQNDYPSLGEVNYMLEKKQKHLILGVTKSVVNLYKEMVDADVIHHAGVGDIGTSLNPNAVALKKLVIEEYNKIDGRIQLLAKNLPDGVTVKLTGNCPQKKETGSEIYCNQVTVDEEFNFVAEIEIHPSVCQIKNPSLRFTIEIFSQSGSKMIVDITPICKCSTSDCGSQANNQVCRTKDNNAQNICGACKCSAGYQGDKCQCSKEDKNLKELEEQCKAGGQICSGHGSCECGVCKCERGYHGKYCGCRENQWGECGDHGQPRCEQANTELMGKVACNCDSGWTGEDCKCSSRTYGCQDPFTKTECNNKGTCKCNKCDCKNWKGDYCQKDNAVQGKLREQQTCDRIKPCILYDIFVRDPDIPEDTKTGWLERCKDQERYNCFYLVNVTDSNTNITDGHISDGAAAQNNSTEVGEQIDTNCGKGKRGDDDALKECEADVEIKQKDCKMRFRHDAPEGLDDYGATNWRNKKIVYVNYNNKVPYECPDLIPLGLLLGTAGGGAVALFFMIFLSYCIVINVKDRMEYNAFQKERKELWDQNSGTGNKLFKEKKSSMRNSIRNRVSKVSFKS